jgi:hypothetical protein
MPIASVADLKQHESPEALVTVPGTELQIRCRRPDMLGRLVAGLLPLPLLARASASIDRWAGLSPDAVGREVLADPATAAEMAEFIDRWVCAAAVQPRIVMEPTDAGAAALWIEDLQFTTKIAILSATSPAQEAPAIDAAEFPRGNDAVAD